MSTQRPIILGIVGDSASGKSTLTSGLVKLLGEERVTHICTDDYHKYDRRERARLNITALHPDCNYLDILELHLERLHYGQPILKPVYDHSTGSLVRPEYIQPREFVIVEGLLGFHSMTMRQFYDVKVFLNPPEEMRHQWKIRRDVTKRGYTPEQVLSELGKREADSRDYIRSQRRFADVVVRFYASDGVSPEQAGEHLNVRLTLRPTIPHPDLTYLTQAQHGHDSGIVLELDREEGRPVDILTIDGAVPSGHAAELEQVIWQHLPGLRPLRADEFGDFSDRTATRHSDPLAITQLLLTYHLLRQYHGVPQLPFAAPVAALSRLQPSPKSSQEGAPAAENLSVASP
ncbi:MAG: phosphoribulokinase [Chloroflexales bacterium]|nr:phosphoribulokinase [Chloroflexales bacterium]